MNNNYITFAGLCTVVLWTLIANVLSSDDGKVYDLCDDHLLELKEVGDRGVVVFNANSTGGRATNPCIIKITVCSSCHIRVRSNTTSPFDFLCPLYFQSNFQCQLGCDYLYIFDTYYMNETMRYYHQWYNFEQMSESSSLFISESSSLFISFCHGYNRAYSLSLLFESQRKTQRIESNPSHKASGPIMSPYFSKLQGYSQNQETYEYVFTNNNPSGYVRLVFDDWHLAPSSDFYFENSNIVGLVSGSSVRPMVLSMTNTLMVKFRTGSSLEPTTRHYLGFKATYTFLYDKVALPYTNCDGAGYMFNSYGGYIEFSPGSKKKQLYDCVWVVKKQPGYSGITMRIVKFTNPGYTSRGDNVADVRSGVTSSGYPVTVVDQLDNIQNSIFYKDTTAFYIRLNGSYDSGDTFAFVYASYSAYTDCTQGMFQCSNGVCINASLKCDGQRHCQDNSDETTQACGDTSNQMDKSYQYTITIGVIIPMVISVFLIMVICLLFVMIRRCRRARMQEAGSTERLPTLSEDVSRSRGRRRRRHRRHLTGERDLPPTYNEAMQNPPGWYLNVAFANPVDPSLPQPPSYSEAVGQDVVNPGGGQPRPRSHSQGSTDSCQSELTMGSHTHSLTTSSDEGEDDGTWVRYGARPDGRRARRSRHVSSSDETDNQSHAGSDWQLQADQLTEHGEPANEQTPRASPASVRSRDRSEHGEQKPSDPEKVDKLGGEESKCDPKKGSSPTEFVIPDSAKVENEQTDHRSYATRLVQTVLGTRSTPSPNRTPELLRGGHSRNRSMSSESDVMIDDSRRRGRKKGKKSKAKKVKSGRNKASPCLDAPSPNTADHVPCNTVAASNFDTEHVHNQPDSHTGNRPEGVQAEYITEYNEEDEGSVLNEEVERGPHRHGDGVDYETVVNLDNEDIMLVYDTNYCDIPQHQDHFSQSRSVSREISQPSGVAMAMEPRDGYHGDIPDAASKLRADKTDRSDVEVDSSSNQDENCDHSRSHGNGLEFGSQGQGDDSDLGQVNSTGVRYISFTDDLGGDVYV